MHQDVTLYGGWPQPRDFVLHGDRAPCPKRGGAPNFRPTSIVAKRLHGSRCHWYGGRPRALRDIVFDVDPATPRKKGTPIPTQLLAHVYCGQMAWMDEDDALIGTEVDLGPGHIILDGFPAPAKGAQQSPSFRPMSIVATVAHLSYC